MDDIAQAGRFEDTSLDHERRKVARLLASLEEFGVDQDEDFKLDAIEGETNAMEAISALLRRIAEDEASCASLKDLEGQYKGRRERLTDRVTRLRNVIRSFMMDFDIPKIERPEAMLSLSAGREGVGYAGDMDPKALPEAFQRVTVDADKTAIAKAMKADPNLSLPGVYWTNGRVSLTVRTR